MPNFTATEWAMLLTTFFAGLGGLVSAIKSNQAKNIAEENKSITKEAARKADIAATKAEETAEKAEDNNKKLNEVHSLTDGNLTRVQNELHQERLKTQYLEDLVRELTAHCGPTEIEKATKKVNDRLSKIGKRRKTDLIGDSK